MEPIDLLLQKLKPKKEFILVKSETVVDKLNEKENLQSIPDFYIGRIPQNSYYDEISELKKEAIASFLKLIANSENPDYILNYYISELNELSVELENFKDRIIEKDENLFGILVKTTDDIFSYDKPIEYKSVDQRQSYSRLDFDSKQNALRFLDNNKEIVNYLAKKIQKINKFPVQPLKNFEEIKLQVTTEEFAFFFRLLIEAKIKKADNNKTSIFVGDKHVNKSNLSRAVMSIFEPKQKKSKKSDPSAYFKNSLTDKPSKDVIKLWKDILIDMQSLITNYLNEFEQKTK